MMERYDTLLICSAWPENRDYLRHVMGEGFHLLEAANVHQMLLLLEQNISCVAALLLDITRMEEQERITVESLENVELLDRVPVIIISDGEGNMVLNRAFGFGASDVIPLDYDPYAMRHRIENIVELYLHKRHLESLVAEQAETLRHANDSVVDTLSSIIEYRSVESGQHILRIRHFTKILLEEVVRCCPEYNLTEPVISIICSAAALHDIGKISIPDAILMKPEKLTAEEMLIMKTHAVTGCRILDSLADVADGEYLRYAHNICHYHHERWDGGGYPEGLSGESIPICAQVVGLADVYDALTTRRSYKEAFSFSQAVNMILKGECGAFSPKLLECFKHVTDRFEELARDYADGLSPKTETFDTTLPAPLPDRNENSIERIRGKYYALVHYVNGFLMELNMDLGLFHIVYNPYPELAQFQGISTLHEMERKILDELIHPGDRNRMQVLIREGISAFLDESLRRQSDCFRFRSGSNSNGELFEVTFLRINPIDTQRHSLAVLVRRAVQETVSGDDLQLYGLSDAVYTCRNDWDFTLLHLGNGADQLAGYSIDEIHNDFGGKLIQLVHPGDRDMVRREFRRQLNSGGDVKLEFRLLRKDGSVQWVLDKSQLIVDPKGTETIYSAITDITYFKQTNDELWNKLEQYEIILAQTENVLFEWDAAVDRISLSGTWEKIFGFVPAKENLRSRLATGSHFHPDDLPLVLDSLSNIENGSHYEMLEVRIATAKGRYIWCRFRATALRDENGNLQKVSGIIINIDAEKQAERALKDRAEQDSLTKLLNKDACRRQAEDYFNRFPHGAHSALLIIDLDNFKRVNDQFGHLFGDAVLTQVAREIRKLFRNQDIIARIGGDEFLVLMRGISDRNLVESRCQRLITALRHIFQNQKNRLPISCSVGVAMSPDHGRTYYELFNRADQALYWAKEKGKDGFVFYDEQDERFRFQQRYGSAVNDRIDSDEEPGLADDNLVRYAFQRLYASKDVEKSVTDILELVGRKMNVSRVYVFENSDDNCYCSNTFEWCNEGIEPEIHNLQNISYAEDIAGYVEMYDEQGMFYCPDIDELPENIYNIVAPQGIKSLLHCAIREGGIFRGYVGFDECVEQRLWTKEQIQTLSYFSEMLSLFLFKQRKQEKSVRYAEELQMILDNQNAWIYIIDPVDCRLKYLNAKTRELAPDVTPGMCCYEALMGQKARCPGCPSLDIQKTRNSSACLYNSRFDLNVLAEATLIQWNGENSCLLTCRKMPKSE